MEVNAIVLENEKLRRPKGGLLRQIGFLAIYVKTNLLINLEYRAAFFSKIFSMIFNDLIWMFFWWIFFTRFPQTAGYNVRDTLTLWVLAALAIGWSQVIFGNSARIGRLVAMGELDYYLAVPKNVLFHLCISYMDVMAFGDLVFALVAFGVLYRPDPLTFGLMLVLGFFGGLVLLSFTIIAQSLVFFLGNSQGLADQIMFSIITFSTYPEHLFKGVVRAVLYTLIPAAFVSYLPVTLLHQFSWPLFGLLVAVAVVFVALAFGVFYWGLRRYESGNLLQMRS